MVHVVLLGHGSRDPRHAATTRALADAVAARLEAADDVHVAFLDLCAPSLAAAAEPLPDAAEVVVVPLLLTTAFHAAVDVPDAVAAARATRPDLTVRVTPVLGPDDALRDALATRLREAGVDPADQDTGIVVVAAGSSEPAARDEVAAIARSLVDDPTRVRHAFASGPGPTVTDALHELADSGLDELAVALHFVAPGRLSAGVADLLHTTTGFDDVDLALTGELGDAPEVVDLVIRRIRAAIS